jgi:protein involved in polysaccharide export with SLBB domain
MSTPPLNHSTNDMRSAAQGPHGLNLSFDPWRLIYGVICKWRWLIISGIALLVAGFFLAKLKFKDKHFITGKLIRREISGSFRTTETGVAFKPQGMSSDTLVSLMYSGALMARAGEKMTRQLPISEIAGHLLIETERRTELIRVTYNGSRSRATTVEYLKLYLDEVVTLTRNLMQREALEMKSFMGSKLLDLDNEIRDVNEQILEFSVTTNFINADKEADAYLRDLGNLELTLETTRADFGTMAMRISHLEDALRKQNPAQLELNQARDTLRMLLLEYTEKHPKVIQQKAQITSLEHERKSTDGIDAEGLVALGDTVSNTLYLDLVALKSKRESVAEQLKQLTSFRDGIKSKLRELPGKALQNTHLQNRLKHLQEARNVLASRQIEAAAFSDSPVGYYSMVAQPQIENVSTESSTFKIVVVSIVFGVGGILGCMVLLIAREFTQITLISPVEMKTFFKASRSWFLTRNDDAKQTSSLSEEVADEILRWKSTQDHHPRIIACVGSDETSLEKAPFSAHLTRSLARKGSNNVLVSEPEIASFQFDDGTTIDRHHPLPTTPSDSERLLNTIRQRYSQSPEEPGATIILDLPASSPESVQPLIDAIDSVLWVATSGQATKQEFTQLVEKLRSNSVPSLGVICLDTPPFFNHVDKLMRLVSGVMNKNSATVALILATLVLVPPKSLAAQVPPHSSDPPPQPVSWTQRYTLGPGDEMHIRLYGRDDLMRQFIAIAPDGKISYLQARNIEADGLTLDELRTELEKGLQPYFQSPRVILTPTKFASKKYHLLGSIRDSGSYLLSKPTTLVEAIASARGFKTGYFDHNTVELADLARCFLIRNGDKHPIDFHKLFHEGDLSQNIYLEPDDYIYIPSSIVNEVYLLGEVLRPGAIGITTDATVMTVITIRDGFSERAFRDRVLVVRGSIKSPETFVVNTAAILAGKEPDFLLEPRDIIYIPPRPWTHPEEILDLAVKAFVQSAVAASTGVNIGPFIRSK